MARGLPGRAGKMSRRSSINHHSSSSQTQARQPKPDLWCGSPRRCALLLVGKLRFVRVGFFLFLFLWSFSLGRAFCGARVGAMSVRPPTLSAARCRRGSLCNHKKRVVRKEKPQPHAVAPCQPCQSESAEDKVGDEAAGPIGPVDVDWLLCAQRCGPRSQRPLAIGPPHPATCREARRGETQRHVTQRNATRRGARPSQVKSGQARPAAQQRWIAIITARRSNGRPANHDDPRTQAETQQRLRFFLVVVLVRRNAPPGHQTRVARTPSRTAAAAAAAVLRHAAAADGSRGLRAMG